jgi:CCR4-NOT transcriptional complex subunit CAF120
MTTQAPLLPSTSTPQWEPRRSSPSTGFVAPPRFQQLQAQAAHQPSQPAQNHLQFPSSNHPSPANNFSTDSSSEMPSHARSPSFFSSFRRQSNESQSSVNQRAVSTNGGTNPNPPALQQNAPSTPMQQVQPRPQTNSYGQQQQPQTPQQIPPNLQPAMGQQQGAMGRTITDVQPPPTAPSPSTGQAPAPLHPEIRSVVQLTIAHAHKIYFSGPLVRRIERQADGQRPTKDEGWVDVWAQLGGTTLSVWDMKEIQEASKQGREVPPTYVNVMDAVRLCYFSTKTYLHYFSSLFKS